MEDLKNKLNSSQLTSVTTINGPVLVIAGAGSGKTRTIEYRVLNLVHSGVKPQSILLLTFTRKAAGQMISRASRHDARCRYVDGGTFHSFAFRMLRRHAKVLGLAETFSILDEGDSAEAVYRCAHKLDLIDKDRKFPKKATLRTIISMSVNKSLSILRTIEKEYPHFLQFADEIEALRKEYTAYKIRKSYLDYDDLLIYLRALLEIKDIRERSNEKYRFIMVDEYQDTNSIQGDISYLLAKEHGNIMVVGDDAQSIYGFRGSSHKNIMDFPKRFKDCKIIKLEENYRSTQAILDVANAALDNMTNRYSKCLISQREEAGDKPKLQFFKNAYDEAEWIAEKIKDLRAEGAPLSQQAVLFRSVYVSIALQAELSKHNIPYEVFGGLKFYETAHVKDLISHLKAISNPKDEIAWTRILTLIEGVGPKTADKLSEEIVGCSDIDNIVKKVFKEGRKITKSSRGLGRLKSYLKSAKSYKLGPGALYDLAFDYYLPLFKEKFDDWHIRSNDLEALRQIAARYKSLEDFLADFSIEPPDRGVWGVGAQSKDEESPLTLSTIHSAKGLEWDTVFLIGLIEGVLPSSFSLDDEEEIEEENRLFYVAITRAKNRLYLSLNHEGVRGGIMQFNKMSRFLEAPEVLSCLDQKVIMEHESHGHIDLDEQEVRQVYDKDSLIDYIDNIYDRF